MNSLEPAYRAILSDDGGLSLDDIDPLVDFALAAGLGPLLYRASNKHPNQASSRHYQRLWGADMTARVLTGKQLDAVTELAAVASGSIDFMVGLKGISASLQYYPAAYMRTMGDLDLLVRADQQQVLESICLELGYVRRSHLPAAFYEDLHHSMPLYHPGNDVWIEVHKGLFPARSVAAADSAFTVENIHREAVGHLPGVVGLRALSPELELVYTCTHWAVEANWLKGATRILDVLLILHQQKSAIDWNKVFFWLETSPVAAKSLYLMLSYLLERRMLELPEHTIRQLSAYRQNISRGNQRLLHALIDKYTLQGSPFGRLLSPANVNIVWSTLLYSDGPTLSNLLIRLPRNILLPPSSADRRSFQFQWSRIKNLLGGS